MGDEATFDRLAAADRSLVEARLGELVDELAASHAGMREAMRYSVLGGGKRLRPLLCLWTHDLFAGPPGSPAPSPPTPREAALDAACAVECVHTYSLIHDDLPCMDDDDLRRGRASSHRRFGEGVAVLAGDALLNAAYEIMATLPRRHAVSAVSCLEATATLAAAAGVGGLIAGQALDLEAPADGDLVLVQRIHEAKTARLFAAAMEVGAIIAGARTEQRERVRTAGMDAGRAFQIVDDLLDLEGSREALGKTPRKDIRGRKLTFPSVAGLEASRRRSRELAEAAMAALPEAGGTPLAHLIRFITGRSH